VVYNNKAYDRWQTLICHILHPLNLLPVYVPREQNVIQKILKDHFSNFEEWYDDLYTKQYGKYRIIHIKEAVEKFLECGKEVTKVSWFSFAYTSMKKEIPRGEVCPSIFS